MQLYYMDITCMHLSQLLDTFESQRYLLIEIDSDSDSRVNQNP